jgi:arylsulfatase A-like enzyme
MIRNIFLFPAVVFALLFFGACRQPAGQSEHKNVLLITIDTLRADHLGCYGYSRKITPTLDRLSENGILFENAFCAMPTTVPSHGSIFFGTWPRIHGSLSNSYLFSNRKLAFMPALLQKAGYTTSAFVSSRHLANAMSKVAGFNNLLFIQEQKASATLNMALKWFAKNQTKPFFVWIHLWDPHWPYDLHPEIMPKINRDFRDDIPLHHGFLSKETYTPESSQKMIDLYDNEIGYTDHQLGLFFEELRKTTQLENTMILIMSDHGESLNELAPKYNYAFDHGEFLFDSELHVPLIVVLPQKRHAGSRVRQVVTLLDVMPSVLQFSGLPIPKSVDGRSFLSLIQQKNSESYPDSIFVQRRIFGDQQKNPAEKGEQVGIRSAKYKLIYNLSTGSYDTYKNFLEWEPFQLEDAAKNRMLLQLKQWLKQTESRIPTNMESVTPEKIENLKSLGYVQ